MPGWGSRCRGTRQCRCREGLGASNLADKGRTRSPGWKLELDKFNLEISQQPEQLNAGAGGGRGRGGGSGSLGSNRFGRGLQACSGTCQLGSAWPPWRGAARWALLRRAHRAPRTPTCGARQAGTAGRRGGICTAASHAAFVLSGGLARLAGGNMTQGGEGTRWSCRCCMCCRLPWHGACPRVQASPVPRSCPGCRPQRICQWTQAWLGPCELRSPPAAPHSMVSVPDTRPRAPSGQGRGRGAARAQPFSPRSQPCEVAEARLAPAPWAPSQLMPCDMHQEIATRDNSLFLR